MITFESIRQLPPLLYSVACIIASCLFPLAIINSVKAFCAMKSAISRRDNESR